MIADVVIAGGGVIGLTTAYELAGRGLRVTLLDQQQPGREASWAGAGILPPAYPGDPSHPLAAMCRVTNELWPGLTAELRETTGIDNGFRRCGGIGISESGDAASVDSEINAWSEAGAAVESLGREEIETCEPAINPEIGAAYRLPQLAQVRNPRHLKALLVACGARGVDIRIGQRVCDFEQVGDRVCGVRTLSDRFAAGAVVVTAGAWSQELLAGVGCRRRIEPVRGQMVLLALPRPAFRHVIECGPRYLVPREDGRVLIGSTEEWVGFDKQNTSHGVRGLLTFAERLVPALSAGHIEQAWAGLRPHAVDGLPLIGQVGAAEKLFVAAGHFRSGLHLSPVTARVVAQLIAGEVPDVSLGAFSPSARSSG